MSLGLKSFRRDMHSYSRAYWVLVASSFVYATATSLAFPFEGIYLRSRLHMSMSWIGFLYGIVPLTVIPLQLWGGHLTDRFGRRRMIMLAVLVDVGWFVGIAFARHVWQVAALVFVECACGWPLFQTAANAMVADLAPAGRRREAYSISRIALNLGVVIGPVAGGLARSANVSYRLMFLAAAVGCAVATVILAIWISESRPESVAGAQVHVDAAGRSGYRLVAADRRFMAFCLAAVLCGYCCGQFGIAIFAVFVVVFLHMPAADWGLLFGLNALVFVTVQYPLIRRTRRRDPLLLLAISSLLLAVGFGLNAFAASLWFLVVLVIVISLGMILILPIATTVVGDVAPEPVRGRYMGVWTAVWSGGLALGTAIGGLLMDRIGARGNFVVTGFIGLAGAAFFLALGRRWRLRLKPPGDEGSGGDMGEESSLAHNLVL